MFVIHQLARAVARDRLQHITARQHTGRSVCVYMPPCVSSGKRLRGVLMQHLCVLPTCVCVCALGSLAGRFAEAFGEVLPVCLIIE